MHGEFGDYLKDCGAHHFCPSALPYLRQYASGEIRIYPFVGIYSSCIHPFELLIFRPLKTIGLT